MQAALELAKLGYELEAATKAGTLGIEQTVGAYKALHTGFSERPLAYGLDTPNAVYQARRKADIDLHRILKKMPAAKRQKTGRYKGPRGPGNYKGAVGLSPSMQSMVRAGYTRQVGLYNRFNGQDGMVREVKFLDTAMATTVASTAVVTDQLNIIEQGTTSSERVGQKTKIHSVQIRGEIRLLPGASASIAGVFYMLLVQDRQANGAAAAVTDVMTSSLLTSGMINMSNSSRFKIHRRWVVPLNVTASRVGGTVLNHWITTMEYFQKVGVAVEFSGTTGVIGEIKSNNLFVIMGCNTEADGLIQFEGACRIRFSD